jgi:hypothetical protein
MQANMTDYPRFRSIDAQHDDRHRYYHGAPVVDFVLGLADWWLSRPHHNASDTALSWRRLPS